MKKTCFIIEDNPAFVKVLEKYVEKLGYLEITGTYPDSIGAARSIFRNKPDLIFLDVGISGLTGPEMLEEVEVKPKTIVVSNHAENTVENLGDHIDAFIQKPVKFEDFKKVVDNVMSQSAVS